MKRWKKLLALLLCAVLLFGGYTLVQKMSKETETVSETSGTFPLTQKAKDDVTGIRWTKNDVTYDFAKIEGVWQLSSDPAFPVDTSAVDSYVEKVVTQTGIRRIENVEKLADYGLETPAFRVELTFADGTAASFLTGNATPFGDGYYAMSSAVPTTVYTVSANLSASFTKTMDDFAKLEDMPSFEGADRIVIGTALDITKSGNDRQLWYAGDTALDDASVSTLLTTIQSLSWSAYAGSADSKADFGIPEESTITVYNGDDVVYSLCVGNASGTDYYAYVPGAKAVYTIGSTVKNVLTASVDSLRRMTPVVPAFDDTDSFTMTAGDASLEWVAPADGGDAPANQEAAKAAWEQLTALTASSHTVLYEEGEPLLTVRWTSGSDSAEMVFMAYNADSYLLKTDDGAMLFPADKLDKLIRSVRYQ